jgi:Xaa-Pro aminopeptidase
MTRLARLAADLEDALLVIGQANLRYLTGLSSSNAAALVEPGGNTTVFTDFRYAEAARGLESAEVVETRRDLFGELAERLSGERVAVESQHLSYADATRLQANGVELVSTWGVVEALRAVKDAPEVDAIRRAAAISDDVFGALAAERFTGRSERDVSWWIERQLRERGAEALAFPVTVAAGANAARPHAEPAAEPISEGTLVIVDAGCRVDGYCSDCTRTFATGDLPAELAKAYDLCLRAQLEALAAIRPGVGLRDADAASRVAIDAAGLGDHYGHGLGHGVGLEVHEAPALRREAAPDAVLEAGNVVTVEPGIYLSGVGGVRIEDLVLVTESGHERLTQEPKGLLVVE